MIQVLPGALTYRFAACSVLHDDSLLSEHTKIACASTSYRPACTSLLPDVQLESTLLVQQN